MTEEELLAAIAGQDQEAFKEFYSRTVRPVYSYILSLTKNRYEAEDVLQDTYLRIWTGAGEYRSQGKPLAWVFTIARNLCYMKFREQKLCGHRTAMEPEGLEEGQVCDGIEQAGDRELLLNALGRLKEEDRQVVLLHAAAGMKHREVAQALQLPLATVLSKYNRSMKRLQQFLGRQDNF